MDKVPECVPELCLYIPGSNDASVLDVSAAKLSAVSSKGTNELDSLLDVDGCIASLPIRKRS
jgi:hypothetical protein